MPEGRIEPLSDSRRLAVVATVIKGWRKKKLDDASAWAIICNVVLDGERTDADA